MQGFQLQSGQGVILSLDWDSPYYTANGVKTSLNIYVVDTDTGQVIDSGTTDATQTQTPYQIVGAENLGGSTVNCAVVVQLAAGPAPAHSSTSITGPTNSATSRFSTRPIARRSTRTRPPSTRWLSPRRPISTR